MLYSEAVGLFLTEKTAELSPYSVAHLRSSLAGLGRALGDVPVDSVTYSSLRAYVDGLYLRYRPGTIRPIVGDIRQFFRWARKRKLVAGRPAKRLRGPSRRMVVDAAVPRAAPEADVRQVIDYLASRLARVVFRDVFGNLSAAPSDCWAPEDRGAIRDLFVIVYVYETGARVGELRRLSSRAMDAATASPGPVYHVISTGKTGYQTSWFTSATAELWSVWSAARPRGCDEYAVVSWQHHGMPEPITRRDTISQALVRRCRQAGVRPFRTHALRHARALRGTQTVGLELTSRLLGHSSVMVTASYATAGEFELQNAAAKAGLPYRLWA